MVYKPRITFEKTTVDDTLTLYLKYTASLRLVDTFWEDNILEAQIYSILCDGSVVGCFSILSNGNMLTSFLLNDSYVRLAQEIFLEIISAFSPCAAFVATNEELFLALCLEHQANVELQAFFFDYSDTKPSSSAPAHPASWISEATDDDLPDLLPLDFFHPLAIGNPEDTVYVLRNPDTNKFLGAGHIARMQLARQWGAVGMVTHPDYRKQGVGRSIIIHLTQIAALHGLIPIAGCWSKNLASKNTLESCGYTSKTRLLKVFFNFEEAALDTDSQDIPHEELMQDSSVENAPLEVEGEESGINDADINEAESV